VPMQKALPLPRGLPIVGECLPRGGTLVSGAGVPRGPPEGLVEPRDYYCGAPARHDNAPHMPQAAEAPSLPQCAEGSPTHPPPLLLHSLIMEDSTLA
jgi:hypothetical protein